MKAPMLLAIGFLAACTGGGWQVVVYPPVSIQGMAVDVKSEAKKAKALAMFKEKGPASFIERELHKRGLVFGTDGTGKALCAYLAGKLSPQSASQARKGDIVAFNLGDGCGGRVGLVESVESDGHLVFREWRGGAFALGHATPSQPMRRRDGNGRVLNSFLRPVELDDLPGTKYFAGEMFCALYRAP